MRVRRLLLGAAVLLLLAAPLWGPLMLRRVGWFGVQRVEVSGLRLLAPHEVLAASGIHLGQNIWDDPAGWEAALREHPVVADARIERELSHTLRVRIEEWQPVGLIEVGTLRLSTADGRLLPVDPARAAVDLPLVRAPGGTRGDGRLSDAGARMLMAELGRLRQLDPELVGRISEVRLGRVGTLRLTLSQPDAELVLPRDAAHERLRQLRSVLNDLEQRGSIADTPAGRGPVRVDLRFRDQIVVGFPSSE